MRFQPKLLSTLKNYSKEQFYADLMAGIIVGMWLCLWPLLFGIVSGSNSRKGFVYGLLLPGFIISFLGGSKVRLRFYGGFCYCLWYRSGILTVFTGLAVATMIAGVMLDRSGLLKLGSVINLYHSGSCWVYKWYSWYHFYHLRSWICFSMQTGGIARWFYS